MSSKLAEQVRQVLRSAGITQDMASIVTRHYGRVDINLKSKDTLSVPEYSDALNKAMQFTAYETDAKGNKKTNGTYVYVMYPDSDGRMAMLRKSN